MAWSPRSFLTEQSSPFDADRTVVAVAGITLVALVLRFAFLGQRIAHWDEARVAYWTLHYLQTGEFHYRFIIHGPFVQIVNRQVFALFGPTDFTARAIVALVGGLLPMVSLLFRNHLRDRELVILALLLATNPILLYYSRFFRSSLLVAAFMLTAFGLLVRAYGTCRLRYVHAAIVLIALGFTAKENAVVYLVVWLGAAVLLLDHSLYRPYASTPGVERLQSSWQRYRASIKSRREKALRYVGHGLLAGALFVLVVGFFHAPRTGDPAGIGLWQAMTNPGRVPALIDLTVGHIIEGYSYWFGGASEPGCFQPNVIDSYLCFLKQSLQVLAGFGAVVVAFGVVGFLHERYWVQRSRNLVMFASYWGFASLLGYPLGMDVFGPWVLVNVIVPLAIPAAVGLGVIYRLGRDAFDDDDRLSTGIAAVVLLVVIGQVATAGISGVYRNPQNPDNGLVQYAQPAGDFRQELGHIGTVAANEPGPHVIMYGEWLVDEQTEAVRKPACIRWFNALPLPWYFAANDVGVACATNQSQLDAKFDHEPAVVITRANETAKIAPQVDGYAKTTYDFRAGTDPRPPRITFFVRTSSAGNST